MALKSNTRSKLPSRKQKSLDFAYAVSQLEPEILKPFLLHHEGLTDRAIGRELGICNKTAKRRYIRARNALVESFTKKYS